MDVNIAIFVVGRNILSKWHRNRVSASGPTPRQVCDGGGNNRGEFEL